VNSQIEMNEYRYYIYRLMAFVFVV